MGEESSNLNQRGVLICLDGKIDGEIIKLRRDATILGREKSDVVVADNEVSSIHCQIQNINGTFHIFDMNSSNGTFVNNEKVVKAILKVGDIIVIGKTKFKFELKDEKRVRHIPTLFKSGVTSSNRGSGVVEDLIEKELEVNDVHTVIIEVEYGGGESESIELRQRVIYIGRASTFGKFDADTEISRKHLMVKINDGGEVFVEDQGSTNGSRINGHKITGMHRIAKTDVVQVGLCKMKIYLT
ncbi:MAG: hypothetical protein CMP10_02595 [Zetaproteobacteria bacterium]|nr:hypothetical protein [Pseudobdellovibrionaceae bacterium]